jgi:hypothetical protein
MAAQEKFTDSPERNKGPTLQAGATREKEEDNHGRHPEVEPERASSSGKRRNIKENLIWDLRPEKHETISQGSRQDSKNHGMDTVEGSTPSEPKIETTSRGGVTGNVEVPASPERVNV